MDLTFTFTVRIAQVHCGETDFLSTTADATMDSEQLMLSHQNVESVATRYPHFEKWAIEKNQIPRRRAVVPANVKRERNFTALIHISHSIVCSQYFTRAN